MIVHILGTMHLHIVRCIARSWGANEQFERRSCGEFSHGKLTLHTYTLATLELTSEPQGRVCQFRLSNYRSCTHKMVHISLHPTTQPQRNASASRLDSAYCGWTMATICGIDVSLPMRSSHTMGLRQQSPLY